MKQLYEYVVESAIGNIGISFEEFKDIVGSGKGTKSTWQKFGDAFGDSWDIKYKVFLEELDQMLIQMDDMGVELDDNILRFIYDKFCNTPESIVRKMIGKGMWGAAYDLGDKIIKLFFDRKIPAEQKKFYELCKTGKYKVFPKVYRIGKGYVVMEKLQVHTKKCTDIYRALFSRPAANTGSLYQIIQDDQVSHLKIKWNGHQKQAIQFMKDVREALDELGYDSTDYGDLSIDNIGERADGTVVYFDI